MSEANIWNLILEAIEKKINHESFMTWFKPISFLSISSTHLRLLVPDSVFEDWILNNYRDVLEEAISEVNLLGISIDFELAQNSSDPIAKAISMPRVSLGPPSRTPSLPIATPRHNRKDAFTFTGRSLDTEQNELPLNQRYTFETFVVGSCNQFAHAAALAVADSPSRTYNPLYLYGGVGLGKTHLMCAIGRKLKEQNSHLRLSYISAEKFMNELINAIRYDQTMTFRDKYRSIDVLLIDDIQFIAGKERTQEEFFHTFNALYDGQKQIVISSDCAPKDIPTLEERLHSRFEWGLIADIQSPDLETKVAILRKKAESEQLYLPDEVAMFIANKIKSNIRELEGSLVRLTALSSLKGETISLALAQEALKNIIEEERGGVTIETVQRVVADFYNLKVADLKSKTNSRNIAVPRQVAMYLCKTLGKFSLPEIGRAFGGKHHTTVLYSINKIAELYQQKGSFHRVINSLIDRCR